MTLSGKTLQWKEKVTKGGISLLKRKERRSQARAKQQTRSNNWPVISYTACKRKKEKEHPRSLIVESKRQKKKKSWEKEQKMSALLAAKPRLSALL